MDVSPRNPPLSVSTDQKTVHMQDVKNIKIKLKKVAQNASNLVFKFQDSKSWIRPTSKDVEKAIIKIDSIYKETDSLLAKIDQSSYKHNSSKAKDLMSIKGQLISSENALKGAMEKFDNRPIPNLTTSSVNNKQVRPERMTNAGASAIESPKTDQGKMSVPGYRLSEER